MSWVIMYSPLVMQRMWPLMCRGGKEGGEEGGRTYGAVGHHVETVDQATSIRKMHVIL